MSFGLFINFLEALSLIMDGKLQVWFFQFNIGSSSDEKTDAKGINWQTFCVYKYSGVMFTSAFMCKKMPRNFESLWKDTRTLSRLFR